MKASGPAAIAAAATLAIAAGCGGSSDSPSQTRESHDSARSTSSAIVGGATDTTRPDVLLLQDDTVAGFRCTATLIAPNLVITARHCVGFRVTGTTLCRGDATDDGAASLPNYMGDVAASPMYLSESPSSPVLARATAVFDDGSPTACAHDVALIQLDRNVAGITPSQLRLTPVAPGDALVAMGFGWTDRNATINAADRQAGTTHVLTLGPTVYSFKQFGDPTATPEPVAIAAGEIGVEGITMTGDSGGPAFDTAGRLVSVVSRGYPDTYYGPATFTTALAHLATINMALVATGNAPLGDEAMDAGVDAGEIPPPKADSGAPSPSGPSSPSGPADGDSGASGAAPVDNGSSSGSSSGCSVAATPSCSPLRSLVSWLIGLALALGAGRRRLRRRR